MPNFAVNFYTAGGTLIQTETLTPDKAWDGGSGTATSNGALFCSGVLSQSAAYFTITGAGDAFGVDNLTFSVPGTQTSVASGGSTLDTTPTILGTLSRALVGGETVHVVRDGTDLGAVATVSGTNWSYTDSVAAGTSHTYTAQIVSAGTAIATANNYSVSVLASPLVLDLTGDGIHTLSASAGVQFDILGTGHAVQTGWIGSGDGFLGVDLNGNGRIDSGAELFGEGTRLADGSLAQNAYQALAQYDTNHDGKIDASDAIFSKLVVWQDVNVDGVSQAGELKHLSDLGIVSLNLNPNTTQLQADNGNIVSLFSSYTTADGATHQMADVYFQVGAQSAAAASPVSVAVNTVAGTAGNDTLTGLGSHDVFVWKLADHGTSDMPAANTIANFNPDATNGDRLDLRDLLQGERHQGSDVGNLTDYLHFTVDAGSTTIEVRSQGTESAGPEQKIVLTGVDLAAGIPWMPGQSVDQAIIHNLLQNGKLVVD
jgi:hypothetical protein